MKKIFVVFALSSIFSLANAAIENNNNRFGILTKVGSNGIGVDVLTSVNSYLKFRFGYSDFNYNSQTIRDNVSYDYKLSVGGWTLLSDLYPFGNEFKISFGGISPNHSIRGPGKYLGYADLGYGVSVPKSTLVDLDLRVEWSKVSPYFGFGYDNFNKIDNGLFFNVDVGAIYAGSPKISLNANCKSSIAQVCNTIKSDSIIEESKIKNELNYRFLPVVQVGIGYKF